MRRHRVALRFRHAAGVLAAGLVIGTALALPTTAHADEAKPGSKSSATVGLNTASATKEDGRGVFDYEVLPRGVVQDHVAVTNYRDQPITVRLFPKDATSSLNSGFDIQPSAEKPRDVGSWISMKVAKLTIKPRQQVIVPFQLGVPYNATPGDHAGAIVVSLLAQEPKPDGGSIIVDHRLGMRIHLRVPGDLKPALAVDDVKVDWDGAASVTGRGDAEVSYTVRNTGNIRMNATGDLRLERILGLPGVDARIPVVEDLLPGGVARFVVPVKDVFGTGPMKAEIKLRGVPVDREIADRTTDARTVQGFSAWPWLPIAIVIGLIALAGAGGWYERRRRRLRSEAAEAEEAEEGARRASAKHRMLVRLAVPVIVALGLVGPGLHQSATAAKGDTWKATLTKKEGIALEPFDVETSGGCPAPATNVIGYGYGKGFPAGGAIVVSNIDGPVSAERGFTVALADSMKNLMADQPAPTALQGTYKFVIRCIEAEFPDKSYGEYVAALTFDKPDHWVALPPLTKKTGPVAQIPTTGPDGEPLVKPGAGGTAQPGQGAEANSPDAAARAAAILAQDAEDDGGPSWPLLGLGIAVAVGSLLLVFGRRIPGPWRRS